GGDGVHHDADRDHRKARQAVRPHAAVVREHDGGALRDPGAARSDFHLRQLARRGGVGRVRDVHDAARAAGGVPAGLYLCAAHVGVHRHDAARALTHVEETMVDLVTLLQGGQPTGADLAAAAKNANALLGAGLGLGLAVIGVGLGIGRIGGQAVEARERRIQQQLEEAERARAEAARLLEEHKRTIASAKAEAQEILARAKAVADKERETLLAKARQEYEQLLERARQEIGAEKEKAIEALRREAVDLTIAAASKLLEAQLDSETNRKLVMEYLAQLEAGRTS